MATRRAHETAAEIQRIAARFAVDGGVDTADFWKAVDAADTDTLVVLVGLLGSTGNVGARMDGLRDGVVSKIHQRLTDQQVTATNRLKRSTTLLAVMAIVVTVLIGVAQCFGSVA